MALETSSKSIIIAASAIIIAAGIKVAAGLIVPFLMAAFISMVAATPIFWLQKKKIPTWLAISGVTASVVTVLVGFGAVAAQSANSFLTRLPYYRERLATGLLDPIATITPSSEIYEQLLSYFDPEMALNLAGRIISSLSDVLSNSFLILLTVIFILAEATSFPKKLETILRNPTTSMPYFREFAKNVNQYLAIKTIVSMLTAVIITIGLMVIGVDFPVLWGILAFFLNFIPTIGSIIAAVPAVLLALLQLGQLEAITTAMLYLTINIIIGNALEPRFMAKGLGLSALVVFLSLIFWGWMLGPVGMLLSVPLTIIAKLALEANPSTTRVANILGPESPATKFNHNSKNTDHDL